MIKLVFSFLKYICSGSDDFCVYVWKNIQNNNDTTSNNFHLKLKGHRSIVNQVRYNSKFHLLVSSGVEKVIKVWTPFKLDNSIGGLMGERDEYLPKRKLYTNRELFELRWFPHANQTASNIEAHQSMEEDQAMIAFFDSLVRREMNNWSNEDNEIINNVTDRHELSSSSSSSDDDTSIRDSMNNTDDEDDDDEDKTKRSEELIEFLSDNENDNLSSDSSSCSNISMNSNEKKIPKVKISLRDRLRNLRHRKSMNLTETSEFINVLDSLNVPHGSSNRSRSNSPNEERLLNLRKTSNEMKQDEDVKQEENQTREETKNLNIIKNLNKHRREIELDEDEEDKQEQPNTSASVSGNNDTKFKKSNKTSEDDDIEKIEFRKKRQKQ
jgi:DDB1- and CUL4-associated factor 5